MLHKLLIRAKLSEELTERDSCFDFISAILPLALKPDSNEHGYENQRSLADNFGESSLINLNQLFLSQPAGWFARKITRKSKQVNGRFGL